MREMKTIQGTGSYAKRFGTIWIWQMKPNKMAQFIRELEKRDLILFMNFTNNQNKAKAKIKSNICFHFSKFNTLRTWQHKG